MRKHPTSFTVQLYKADYRNLPKESRIQQIFEPKYYIISPETSSIGRQNDMPLEEGWKDPLEFHIGNDFFKHDIKWIRAMRQLSKSKLWETVITMLLEDACTSMKEKYVHIITNRIPIADRVLVLRVLDAFNIKSQDYQHLSAKLRETIIIMYGFIAKKYEPKALKRHQTGTIFDMWLYGLADPQKNKMRFVISKHYHWFQFHSKVYMYPLHATANSPTLWVIKEQFERCNQEELLYTWLESSLESRFGAIRLHKDNSEHFIMHQNTIGHELRNHKDFNAIKAIVSDDQLSFLFDCMKNISKVFSQVLITGPIHFN